MADFYADSSALVKRHVAEAGTAWLQTVADPASGNTMITSQISIVETISAFQRRVREGSLSMADAQQVRSDFLALCTSEYQLVACTTAIITDAWALLERHPLRAYDAIQLASAIATNRSLHHAGLPVAIMLCSDQRLRQAAIAEGLLTDDPALHP
jgi:uncharacterized protein